MTLTPEQLAELKRLDAQSAPWVFEISEAVFVAKALPALIAAAEREARMRDALEWYERRAKDEAKTGRQALVADAGMRARAALAGDA